MKKVKNEDLMTGDIPEENVLGVHQDGNEDVSMFQTKLMQNCLTQYGLLSIINK